MKFLEAKVLYKGVLDGNKYYEVSNINYESGELFVYKDNKKSDFVIVKFPQVLELRFKANSLFDE